MDDFTTNTIDPRLVAQPMTLERLRAAVKVLKANQCSFDEWSGRHMDWCELIYPTQE